MNLENKTLIESFLPVEEISEEAKIEKIGAARPPISSMHYWWTRKPLIVARAVILASLLPADYNVKKFIDLLGLNLTTRAHYHDLSEDQLTHVGKEIQRIWGDEPIEILDPFAGAGTISFEAMRLGVNTISIDYNPVAHLIEKGTLEYPRLYGNVLIKDVKKGLDWVIEKTRNELENYYPKHDNRDPLAYLWAWEVKCPFCGFNTPLVNQWWLSQRKTNKVYLKPIAKNGSLIINIVKGENAPKGNCAEGKAQCLNPECGKTIKNEHIINDIKSNEKERLLAVVLANRKSGYEYVLPSEEDNDVFNKIEKRIKKSWTEWLKDDLLPIEEMPIDTRGAIWARNYLESWHRLLNPRQKLLFVTLIKKIREFGNLFQEEEKDKEYVKGVMTYLSFLLGKHIDYNCRSTTLNRQRIMAHALTSRGIPMAWDHAEVNPFVDSCGSLIAMARNITEGIDYSVCRLNTTPKLIIKKNSVSLLNRKVPLIITDPPYFDDVQYAELSEFFYVWEKRALKSFYDLGDVPKSEEMSVGGNNRNYEMFERLFRIGLKKMHENLLDNGLLVMFFAHSSIEAWDFVIKALLDVGFRITATWPVHTESPSNPLARGHASIMSSIVIVARKQRNTESVFIEELQNTIRTYLEEHLREFWSHGLRGADLTVAAMGSTLNVLTQYSQIQSYTGQVKIQTILETVQKYVADHVISNFITTNSLLDHPTSFYLYSRLSNLDSMPFDTANLIAKSMDINLKQFHEKGLIKFVDKGKAKGIRIQTYDLREISTPETLIDVVHLVMKKFEQKGFTEAEKEINKQAYGRQEVIQILKAFLGLASGDPERILSQNILQRMGESIPSEGQMTIEQYFPNHEEKNKKLMSTK